MKTKIKYSLLALLVVVSTIISTLSVAIPAFAAGPPATPEEEAKSYLYYKALASCFEQGGTGNVLATDATDGHWFRGGGVAFAKSTVMGYLGDPTDGTASCGDTNLINSAMSLWGLGAGIDAWCNVMQHAGPYRDPPENNRDCATGTGADVATTGGNNRADSFKQVVEEAYYGHRGEPQLSDAAKYWMYLQTFEKLCQAQQLSILDPAPTPPPDNNTLNIPNTPKGYKVKVVNETSGAVEEWIYQGKGDPDKNSIINMFDGNGRGDGTPRCGELATRIGENAAAYAASIADRIANTCKAKYAGDTAGLAACDAGFKNKTDATYCTKTYSDPARAAELAACQFGQTKATGGIDGLPATDNPATTGSKTSCVIDGIGWIVCPVLTFMSKIVDGAYNFVSSLLIVQPILTTGNSQGIYDAWSMMRNFANVAFVVAFLIIIFSQLTSVGITNYGVKKMLPRLVAAAVLVNISYWICSIAVDVSNIFGGSVYDLFKKTADNLAAGPDATVLLATGNGWEGIVGAILAGTIAAGFLLYISLSALVPALIVALLAIVTVFVVLTVRQALIILLIVVSPLAFVAYLLPNTESLFKKWYELFKTMLLMYPIIGLMFGASALASKIVMSSATGQYKIAVQIMGALVAIVPLALTPMVMKAAGGLLGKVGGFVNNPNKGPFDRMKKGAEGFAKDRKNLRKLNGLDPNGKKQMFGRGAATRYGARKDAIRAGREAEVKRANSKYIASQASNPKFANALAGGTNGPFGSTAGAAALARALAGAKFTIQSAEAEEVKAASAIIEGLDQAGLVSNLDNADSSDAIKAASLERLIKIGDPKDYERYVNQYGSGGDGDQGRVIRNSLANALAENGPKSLKASDIDTIRTGQMGAAQRNQDGTAKTDAHGNEVHNASTIGDMAKASVGDQRYTQEKMASDTKGNIDFAWENADSAGKASMVATASALKQNETLKGRIGNVGAVDAILEKGADLGIVGGTAPAATPPSPPPPPPATP